MVLPNVTQFHSKIKIKKIKKKEVDVILFVNMFLYILAYGL